MNIIASNFWNRSRHTKKGIALISVLAIVVLLTALIVAFMMRAGSERVATGYYQASVNTKFLADTALNLVEGQINEATSYGNTYAWASQPGAIRLFDNSGNLSKIFRLYSAPSLTTAIGGATTASTALSPDVPTGTWSTYPAIWVDLNSPVADSGGIKHYPILDTSKLASMDGFSVTWPGATSSSPAPMPVQWLYVLQNGQIIAPDASPSSTKIVTFTSAPSASRPTASNPIVGRLAFWTDDETCKVNVNTAGADGIITGTGGSAVANATFWSTPFFASTDDANLGIYQPVQGEFQRYPGHPATVALNSVLSGLGLTLAATDYHTNAVVGSTTVTNGYTPRYVYGGSQGATVATNITTGTGATAAVSTSTRIPLVSSRLYASVAEMLFTPTRTLNPTLGGTGETGTVPKQQMETARFFLTAHSRAPELTLFGLPRVSVWPESSYITTDIAGGSSTNLGKYYSASDRLLAFDATIGGSSGTGYPYYFTRQSPQYSNGNSSDIGIARNQTLLNYLDYFTTQSVPGFGGNFSSKAYNTGNTTPSMQSRQILTEIFDYIRTINIADQTVTIPYAQGWTGGPAWGSGQVAPSIVATLNSNSWKTEGLGSMPRLAEVSLHFVAMGAGGKAKFGKNGSATAAVPVSPGVMNYAPRTLSGGNRLSKSGGTTPAIQCVTGDVGSWTGTSSNNTMTYGTVSGTSSNYPYPAPGGGDTTYGVPASGPYNQVYSMLNSATQQYDGIPPDNTTAVQAFLLLTFINPVDAMVALVPDPLHPANMQAQVPNVWIKVSGFGNAANSFSLTGQVRTTGTPVYNPLIFPGWPQYSNSNTQVSSDLCVWGGGGGWCGGGMFGYNNLVQMMNGNHIAGPGPQSETNASTNSYPFYSGIIPIQSSIPPTATTPNPPAVTTMSFLGGTLTFTIYDGSAPTSSTPTAIQTVTCKFNDATLPIPTFVALSIPWTNGAGSESVGPIVNTLSGSSPWPAYTTDASGENISTWVSRWREKSLRYNRAATIIDTANDVVISNVLASKWSDPRTHAVYPSYSFSPFTPHSNYYTTSPYGSGSGIYNQMAHNLFYAGLTPIAGNTRYGTLVKNALFTYSSPLLNTGSPLSGYFPVVSSDVATSANTDTTSTWKSAISPTTTSGWLDWDNGVAGDPDGPWINKTDEGSLAYVYAAGQANSNNELPYFGGNVSTNGLGTNYVSIFFTPNRQMPSPGMFGSLPTGVDPAGSNPQGWQTLLFRPGPGAAGYGTAHPGEGTPSTASTYSPPYTSPPDHLWLDLFWMPICEPYAISEPFSTAGKVNMNYQIIPFTYIKRATALRAALASEKVAEVGLGQAGTYKAVGSTAATMGITSTMRWPLDLDATIAQFDTKFSNWDIFRSASQICEEFLVPKDGNSYTATTFGTAWYASGGNFDMVGDNVKERPYTNLYGKLTTKSNTFTVYYRVQVLKNPTTAVQTQWDESKGSVGGEYRGSTIVERYLNSNEPNMPDYASGGAGGAGTWSTSDSMEKYYKWRVVENHQFAP
jgi:uncharacterized protein (TIGR02600 family)